MANLKKVKGIWISKTRDNSPYYETTINEKRGKSIGFIPFENSYEARYLGSVGFLDINREISKDSHIYSRMGIDHGLLQNKFYPLGPIDLRPELVGKGLARRIELEVARDLLENFAGDMPIVIGATSDEHVAYCNRLGFIPWEPMTLSEYFGLLNH